MTYEVYLAHHGVKGQKWGVRRYQNPDGALTDAGKKRYMKTAEKTRATWDKKFTKAKKRANSFALRHPYLMGKGYTEVAAHRKVTSAKKARKAYEKGLKVFDQDSKTLKKMGLSNQEIDRYSELGKAFSKKSSFYSSTLKAVEKKSFANMIENEAAADFKAKKEAKAARKRK